MARSAKLNAEIWGLDQEITLEKVQELQKIRYCEPINYLIDREDLSAYDKTLMHEWNEISPIMSYKITEGEKVYNIRYFTSTGTYQMPMSVNQAIINNIVLPKINRVNTYSVNTIFLENNGRVYVIVYGSGSMIQIRTILMGGGLKQRRRKEWGNIQQKLQQYNLESDFFYWLFNKKHHDTTICTNCGDINIFDIEGIGRYTERRQQTVRAHGANSIGEISNKTALGISQSIEVTDVSILTEDVNAILCLSNFSECSIEINRCQMIKSVGGDFEAMCGNEVKFLLKLYLEVIPGLTRAYNAERKNNQWSNSLASQAKRKWSLEVVKELIHLHKIERTELFTTVINN